MSFSCFIPIIPLSMSCRCPAITMQSPSYYSALHWHWCTIAKHCWLIALSFIFHCPTVALLLPWHSPTTVIPLYHHCPGISLQFLCPCPSNVWPLLCHRPGIFSSSFCHCPVVSLPLPRYRPAVVLSLPVGSFWRQKAVFYCRFMRSEEVNSS